MARDICISSIETAYRVWHIDVEVLKNAGISSKN